MNTPNHRAIPHTHSPLQQKSLKCCTICMNVTMHDLQCKSPDANSCKVFSCQKNWK